MAFSKKTRDWQSGVEAFFLLLDDSDFKLRWVRWLRHFQEWVQ